MSFFSLASTTHHTQQDPTITNYNTNPTSNYNPTDSGSWLLYSTTTGTTHHHRTTADKELDLRQQPPHAHTLSAGGSMSDDGRLIDFADESTWGSVGCVMAEHGGATGGATGGGGGVVSCLDCGNQAKKDCSHLRCRTCCKSRGFECETHVRSTWVPAARRRERQRWISAGEDDHHRRGVDEPNTRRIRSDQDGENPNCLDNTIAATYSSSVFDEGNFPSEVTTPADFRCIRVSSIEEPDDQFAYQATVNIGGHLFKGILYDQGPEGLYMGGDHTSSGGSAGIPQVNLSTISPDGSTIGHSLYASLGGNDYMTSTQFFHQISRD